MEIRTNRDWFIVINGTQIIVENVPSFLLYNIFIVIVNSLFSVWNKIELVPFLHFTFNGLEFTTKVIKRKREYLNPLMFIIHL